MTEGRWYSVAEVAAHLGITDVTLYKMLQRKEMPAHKVGRLWKFKLDEIDDWVKSDKGGTKNYKTTRRLKTAEINEFGGKNFIRV